MAPASSIITATPLAPSLAPMNTPWGSTGSRSGKGRVSKWAPMRIRSLRSGCHSTTRFSMCTGLPVWRSRIWNACPETCAPALRKCSTSSARCFVIAADPLGRGPRSQIASRCCMARGPENRAGSSPHATAHGSARTTATIGFKGMRGCMTIPTGVLLRTGVRISRRGRRAGRREDRERVSERTHAAREPGWASRGNAVGPSCSVG